MWHVRTTLSMNVSGMLCVLMPTGFSFAFCCVEFVPPGVFALWSYTAAFEAKFLRMFLKFCMQNRLICVEFWLQLLFLFLQKHNYSWVAGGGLIACVCVCVCFWRSNEVIYDLNANSQTLESSVQLEKSFSETSGVIYITSFYRKEV